MGGLAIVLAFYTPLLGLHVWDNLVGRLFWENGRQALALIVCGFAIASLGVYDDLKGVNAPKKLAVQFAAGALMWWAGFRVEQVSNPFGPAIELGLASLPITVLWIAGVTNAMNPIDGLAAVVATFLTSFDAGHASDRGHIHHGLMALGLSQRATVLVLYLVCTILAGVAVALTRADAVQTLAYLAGVLMLAFLLLTVVGYVKLEDARRVFVDRKRNLEMRGAVRDAEARLRTSEWLADVWTAVRDAAPALGASCIALRVVQTNGDTTRTEFSHGFDDASPDVLRARYSLLGERPDDGGVELGWTDGRETVDRDTEIAVELLCEHVYAAVGRIEAARKVMAEGGGKVVNLRR